MHLGRNRQRATSAKVAIRSALDNEHCRYMNTLEYYGLKELFYSEENSHTGYKRLWDASATKAKPQWLGHGL